uniref:Uncharacterized protein n=1 Tax=viral metagenome TaxID=1070528 RepID=A0A6C0BZA0_9ZZZZ
MLLKLEHQESVEMCTADNRFMHVKCTKWYHGTPVLDLLPRLRYLLRVDPVEPHEFCATSLFFSYGVLILPNECEDGLIRSVIAMNMGDKLVRVYTNMEMCQDQPHPCSPGQSQGSSRSESPEQKKCPAAASADPFGECSAAGEERSDDHMTLVEEYSPVGSISLSAVLPPTQLSPRNARTRFPTEFVQAHS